MIRRSLCDCGVFVYKSPGIHRAIRDLYRDYGQDRNTEMLRDRVSVLRSFYYIRIVKTVKWRSNPQGLICLVVQKHTKREERKHERTWKIFYQVQMVLSVRAGMPLSGNLSGSAGAEDYRADYRRCHCGRTVGAFDEAGVYAFGHRHRAGQLQSDEYIRKLQEKTRVGVLFLFLALPYSEELWYNCLYYVWRRRYETIIVYLTGDLHDHPSVFARGG